MEFVPLVAEIHEELCRMYGRMHGLDAALREGDARSLEIEEQGQVINDLHDEVAAGDGNIGLLHGEINALNHTLQENAQHSRERLEEKQLGLSQLGEQLACRDQEIVRQQGCVEEKAQIISQLAERSRKKTSR
jgi:hypothetical protein